MKTCVPAANVTMSAAFAARWNAGPVSVPVSRAAALYANFEHVRGVASDNGIRSVERIAIMNAMIDRLRSATPGGDPNLERLRSNAAADSATIAALGDRLHSVAARSGAPYAPNVAPGSIFSVAA
jgi:hypothetical protein